MAVLGYGVRLYNSPAKGSAKGAFLLKTCLILSLCLQMQKKGQGDPGPGGLSFPVLKGEDMTPAFCYFPCFS